MRETGPDGKGRHVLRTGRGSRAGRECGPGGWERRRLPGALVLSVVRGVSVYGKVVVKIVCGEVPYACHGMVPLVLRSPPPVRRSRLGCGAGGNPGRGTRNVLSAPVWGAVCACPCVLPGQRLVLLVPLRGGGLPRFPFPFGDPPPFLWPLPLPFAALAKTSRSWRCWSGWGWKRVKTPLAADAGRSSAGRCRFAALPLSSAEAER